MTSLDSRIKPGWEYPEPRPANPSLGGVVHTQCNGQEERLVGWSSLRTLVARMSSKWLPAKDTGKASVSPKFTLNSYFVLADKISLQLLSHLCLHNACLCFQCRVQTVSRKVSPFFQLEFVATGRACIFTIVYLHIMGIVSHEPPDMHVILCHGCIQHHAGDTWSLSVHLVLVNE